MNMKLLSMFAAAVLALSAVSCASDDIADNGTNGGSQASGTLTTFTAQPAAATRVWMDYNNGKFYWEGGERIWVLDDTNTWRQSSNAATGGVTKFDFQVPGTFGGQPNYKVVYHNSNTSGDQVQISTAQVQNWGNTNNHFDAAGDNGIATASPTSGGEYGFTLAHKAAYLVFEPYTTTWLSSWKLTKIEVNSDNDIAGTFTINPTTGVLSGSGSKQIMLTVGAGSGGNVLSTTAPTPSDIAAYVVIKPGTHKLRVRFWVKNPADNMEGTITRYYQGTYNPGGYYDLAANLKTRDYSGADYIPYYMWDAQWQYWAGHEWSKPGYVAGVDQPTTQGGGGGSAYPHDPAIYGPGDAMRWYNTMTVTSAADNYARQPHFANVPNANEMTWYCMQGDPHWDGDELWTSMGHVYKGGMWFKKKAHITGFRSDKAADNTNDLRAMDLPSGGYFTNSSTNFSTNPFPVADSNQYFYLPALGYYSNGSLHSIGGEGRYWTSTTVIGSLLGSTPVYDLVFFNGNVYVFNTESREAGQAVRAFE